MEIPADLQEKLQDGSANIFKAAMESAQSNGMSEAGAMEVAWNTIKNDYRQDENGNWKRKADDTPYSGKSVQNIGN